MKGIVVAALAGAVFALGLVISGMTVPANVTGFLDVTGAWNPALAFVMAAAIAVHLPFVRLARQRQAPLFERAFHWPREAPIDWKLVGGAAIFGIGWGLSGYCPGPALTSLVAGGIPVLVFVGAMLAGIWITRALTSRE